MFIYILKKSIINLPFPVVFLPQFVAAVLVFFIQDYLHFRLMKYFGRYDREFGKLGNPLLSNNLHPINVNINCVILKF